VSAPERPPPRTSGDFRPPDGWKAPNPQGELFTGVLFGAALSGLQFPMLVADRLFGVEFEELGFWSVLTTMTSRD
jgi:hypothetical protein